MEKTEDLPNFSLLGGPLHRLGRRLGLVRDGTDTIGIGLALGALPWAVLVALALVEGLGSVLFSIEAIGAHVRLLLAIPLLFLCETMIDPRFATFVRRMIRLRVVRASARPDLEVEIARITRWKDAWLPEAFFLLACVLLAQTTANVNLFTYLSGIQGEAVADAVREATWTSRWYWSVCVPLFRFLWLRWLWRLALWCFLLWQMSRMELRLIPTHPDRAAGLGYLEVVHAEFAPMVLAISAVQSASLAQDIAAGRTTLTSAYPGLAIMLFVDALLFVGPLLVFSRKLWQCWVKGLNEYGALAERYVSEFDKKWLGAGAGPAEPLLGTADIQSLADLSTSVSIVRDMRFVPVGPRLLIPLTVAALVPLLPLLLFKYPIAQLLVKFVESLSGL